MKKIDFETMSEIEGGISERSCMLLGGIVVASGIAAIFAIQALAAAIGTTTAAVIAGCFDK